MGGRGTRQEEYQFSTDTKNTENQFYLMVRPSKVVMCGTPFSPNLAARTLQSLYCNAHTVTSFKKWLYPANKTWK
jgi:hypothetical protein